MTAWRRAVHPLLAALALAYLGAMVVTGAMPEQRQFVRFAAKGPLASPPERIRRVELRRGGQQLTLVRTGDDRWSTGDGTDVGAAGRRFSMAVQMMHTSAPVREMGAAELDGLDTAPFGLDPPLFSATLYADGDTPVLAVRFGARNADEFLQYMRVAGDPRLFLMSRFVGEEWTAAMNLVLPK
jgi:hypothetical protein